MLIVIAMMLRMTKDEVIRFFGSQQAVATALGVKQPSVANWKAEPPPLRQLQIERITGGQLRAGQECDAFRTAGTAPAEPEKVAP